MMIFISSSLGELNSKQVYSNYKMFKSTLLLESVKYVCVCVFVCYIDIVYKDRNVYIYI